MLNGKRVWYHNGFSKFRIDSDSSYTKFQRCLLHLTIIFLRMVTTSTVRGIHKKANDSGINVSLGGVHILKPLCAMQLKRK